MESEFGDTRRDFLPAQDSVSNTVIGGLQESKKRKRETIEMQETSDYFEAKVWNFSSTGPSIYFEPIQTILRAHLPLAWLSNRSDDTRITSGAILKASIPSMLTWNCQVLVVRHIPNGAFYAMERLAEETFVCQPLQRFVTTELVQQAAIGAIPPIDVSQLLYTTITPGHTRKQSSSSMNGHQIMVAPSSPQVPKNRRGILARRSILEKDSNISTQDVNEEEIQRGQVQELPILQNVLEYGSKTQDLGVEAISSTDQHTKSDAALMDSLVATRRNTPLSDPTNTQEFTTEQSDVDQLSPEYLRKRYLETLYLSKTSLAFYAKGPLSRTRARTRIPGSSMSPEQLADFYRESILSAKKMDLKYRESIRSKISSIHSSEIIDLEQNRRDHEITPKYKKRNKTKLGKDALWPQEHNFIEQWWRKRDCSRGPEELREPQAVQIQNALSQLRTRETELQIVLILEVLALDAKGNTVHPTISTSTSTTAPSDPTVSCEKSLVTPAGQFRKKRNLESDLDVLLDRLCIWHSVGTVGDVSNATDTQHHLSQTSPSATKDRLRDFCKDVVVPFYGGKLPGPCKAICQKLGGSELSLQQTRLKREKSVGRTAIPGSIVNTGELSHPKRTLERVLSEDHGSRYASPPALLRSATAPSAPVIKREPSERPKSRSTMNKSISFSNREIDLVADAQVTAAKRRKLDTIAAQKRELEAAIEALKKPNRSMVANDFMNSLEKRGRKGVSTKRIEPVQITATPRHVRHRPMQLPGELDSLPMPLDPPRSEEPVVPSSTVKSGTLSQRPDMFRSSSMKRAVLSAIHDTPTKQQPAGKQAGQLETSDCLSTVTTADDRTSSLLGASTPTTGRSRPGLPGAGPMMPVRRTVSQQKLSFTPIRSAVVSMENMFKDAPKIPEGAGRAMARVMLADQEHKSDASIYDSLGWNDDYEL